MLIFIVDLLLVGLAALYQNTPLSFWGVKPNLTLVLLLILGLVHQSWVQRITLIAIGTLLLKFSPLINIDDLFFIASVALGFAVIDYLPWRKIISLGLVLPLATFILNLQAFDLSRFMIELILNLGFGFIVALALKLTYAKEAIS